MPRILHLITGLETGGAERMLARLITRTNRARFPSAVVSMTGPGAIGPQITGAGVRLYDLRLRRGHPDPRGLLRLIRIIRGERPDILQTWLYHADLLGLLARVSRFVPHLVWNLRCTESTNTWVRAALRRFSAVPDAVIVNSATGERFHRGIGYRPRRWLMIPNGFDTALLRPAPEARERRPELGLGPHDFAILLAARYDPMKDIGNFLAAAALVATARPEARFVLAGAGMGADNAELSAAVAARGLVDRVVRLGERRDLDRLYPAFDLVTLSSAYGEGFPNVLGEAMASGVPCVATDTGDCAAIIGDTGEIVPPRHPEALAAAWQRVAGLESQERAALGLRARARIVETYDIDRIVAQYEAAYVEIAGL